MGHKIFAARPIAIAGRAAVLACALGSPLSGAAQGIPASDLLRFPVATLDRPAALGSDTKDGLGNPAAIAPPVGARVRVGVGALLTPADQGVAAQLVSVAAPIGDRLAASISVAHISVGDLVWTDRNPEGVDREIPYSTTLYSASLARRSVRRVWAGLALRYRTGVVDQTRRGGVGVDGGLFAEDLAWRDARLGVASFLWRPAQTRDERTTLNLAGDLRVVGDGRRNEARAGYSLALTGPAEREHFVFGSARSGVASLRAGLARSTVHQQQAWRTRLGIGVEYDKYVVGFAREENGAGLGAIYQFSLAATLQ